MITRTHLGWSSLIWPVLSLWMAIYNTTTTTTTSPPFFVDSHEHGSLPITDATTFFTESPESTMDHMVQIEVNLAFHWNDVIHRDKQEWFMGRLIHMADSLDQAPSWLGFGVYHSNHNYTNLSSSISPEQHTDKNHNLMVGSTAIIGLTNGDMLEMPNEASEYRLLSTSVQGIQRATNDTSIGFADGSIFQHMKESGQVVTVLSFIKAMDASSWNDPSGYGSLRHNDTNVFLWAVGSPGGGETMRMHSSKGVLLLNMNAVQEEYRQKEESYNNNNNNIDDNIDGKSSNTAQNENIVPSSTPFFMGTCGSSLLDDPKSGEVSLTESLKFHWQIVGQGRKIKIILEYTGWEAWLGVGVSPNGQMVGSSAVIGSTGDDDDGNNGDEDLERTPRHYYLQSQDGSDEDILEPTSVQLEDASIKSVPQSNDGSQTITTLRFTKTMEDPNDPVPITKGLTTFLYAVGKSRQMGYHLHRGSFQIDFEACGGKIISSGEKVAWKHHGIFMAHGIVAALAWGLATPMAIALAWFRSLAPSSWIYRHVMANAFTALASLISLILVIVGVSKELGARHFQNRHHWVGLLLVLVALAQVLNGFLRPPIQRNASKHYSVGEIPQWVVVLGCIPLPTSKREAWHQLHRALGLLALGMGVYQIQSGLRLYAERFQTTTSLVPFFWIYLGLVVLILLFLKVWFYLDELRTNRRSMEPVCTTESTHLEDDEGNPTNHERDHAVEMMEGTFT